MNTLCKKCGKPVVIGHYFKIVRGSGVEHFDCEHPELALTYLSEKTKKMEPLAPARGEKG